MGCCEKDQMAATRLEELALAQCRRKPKKKMGRWTFLFICIDRVSLLDSRPYIPSYDLDLFVDVVQGGEDFLAAR